MLAPNIPYSTSRRSCISEILTPAPTSSVPTTPVPTNSTLEFVGDVRLEFGDDVTILGCSDSWIYLESARAPTIQADELLLIMNVQEGVSYSDTLVDSCECFPLLRKIVEVEESQEHDGISCSGSNCWVLASELLTPLDTVSSADVDDLGFTDYQDVAWESFLPNECDLSGTSGRKLLGECRDSWEPDIGEPCPYNSCPSDNCYYCSNDPSGSCDNGCGPASFPPKLTKFVAEYSPFGNGCCNHDHCWVATGEKVLCDLAFLRDNLAGCNLHLRWLRVIFPKVYAACNIVGTAFYFAVAVGGTSAFNYAVGNQTEHEANCHGCIEPDVWSETCGSCIDPSVFTCCGVGSIVGVGETCQPVSDRYKYTFAYEDPASLYEPVHRFDIPGSWPGVVSMNRRKSFVPSVPS